jgi:hypothetical protein
MNLDPQMMDSAGIFGKTSTAVRRIMLHTAQGVVSQAAVDGDAVSPDLIAMMGRQLFIL